MPAEQPATTRTDPATALALVTSPFVMLGDDSAVCVDGVCAVPARPDVEAPAPDRPAH